MSSVSVSLDGNHVWGCSVDHKVYYRAGAEGEWQEVPGHLMKWVTCSADGTHVYGVTANDKGRCFYRKGGIGSEWKQIDGYMSHISVSADGSHVWGVNADDLVFYRQGGSYEGTASWEYIHGFKCKHISVSAYGHFIGAVRGDGTIWRRNGREGSWEMQGGMAKQVYVADKDSVWSVNDANNLHLRLPEDTVGSKWRRQAAYLSQISVSEGSEDIWGVDENGDVWYRIGKD